MPQKMLLFSIMGILLQEVTEKNDKDITIYMVVKTAFDWADCEIIKIAFNKVCIRNATKAYMHFKF